MKRETSRQLLTLVLLLPALACAETPWDCTRQANDQWVCNGNPPTPPQELPSVDSVLEISPEPGELPSPDSPAAEPPEPAATGETSATDKDSTLPVDGTAMRATEPAADASAATMPATTEEAGYDRWALCPPVIRPAPLTDSGEADTIHLQADSAQAIGGNIYTLEGNAVMQYGDQRLIAENIIYRRVNGEIEAQQGIRYTKPGLYVSGESAILYPDLQEGELRNVEYFLYQQHGRGEADLLHLEGVAEQRLEGAYYTTCPQGNENWILSAKRVDLDQETGTGTARDAKLSFKGIPILYTPYVTYPIDDRRKSGLLFPKIGQTNETGLDLSIPFYWNIAPNRDMTIIPRYMGDRGTMLGSEFRYLNPKSRGTLIGDYMPSDKLRDDEYRSLVSLRHFWTPMPRLRTRIIASNASDENYFEDLGNSLLQTSQTNLERTVAADYTGTWWDLSMKAQDFQTVDPNVPSNKYPYKQLPQIVFNANPDDRLLGIKIETSAELNHFVHSDDDLVEGSRLDLQPRLSLPVHHAAWYIDPAVSLRHTTYDIKNTAMGTDDSPSRTMPVASLDAGTFFERMGHWGESSYMQTLEPRLFYLYVPYKNQDDLPVFDTGDYDFNYWTLFRENRFSGPDRMGDANQLAMALTSRILDPGSGRQLISASLGSLLYFSNRNVTLPGDPVETDRSSDIIGEVTMALSRHWNADAELHWDPYDSSTERNDYRLQYRRGPRQLVNLSYRQQRDVLEQTDISFLWPLAPEWHLVGRWYYSLRENETIEALGGIGYESCCWALQLLAQSYINNTEGDRNNTVFMQLELKGLGKLGTMVDDALERGIFGYQAGY